MPNTNAKTRTHCNQKTPTPATTPALPIFLNSLNKRTTKRIECCCQSTKPFPPPSHELPQQGKKWWRWTWNLSTRPPHLQPPHSIDPEPHKRSLSLSLSLPASSISTQHTKSTQRRQQIKRTFVRSKLPQYYTKWRQIWVWARGFYLQSLLLILSATTTPPSCEHAQFAEQRTDLGKKNRRRRHIKQPQGGERERERTDAHNPNRAGLDPTRRSDGWGFGARRTPGSGQVDPRIGARFGGRRKT